MCIIQFGIKIQRITVLHGTVRNIRHFSHVGGRINMMLTSVDAVAQKVKSVAIPPFFGKSYDAPVDGVMVVDRAAWR